MVKLTKKEKRNLLIRIGSILVLIGLFSYQNVVRAMEDRQMVVDRDSETVYLMAESFGYEGNKDALKAIGYLDQVGENNLTRDQQTVIERNRHMLGESKFLVGFKRASIIFAIISIPYLIFEYFLNRL